MSPTKVLPGRRQTVVLIAHDADLTTGASRVLLDLARGVESSDLRTYTVCPGPGQLADALASMSLAHEVVPKFPRRGIPMLGKGARATLSNLQIALFRARYAVRVASALRTSRVDIVHVNTLVGLSAAVAAATAGLPIVWHVHEHPRHFAAGRGLRVAAVGRMASRVVAVSDFVATHLASQGVPRAKIVVVPNGIDLEALASAAADSAPARLPPEAAGRPLVGMAGQLTPLKGFDLFIDLAEALTDAGLDAHFVALGDRQSWSFEAFATRQIERVAAGRLSSRFTIPGHQPDIAPWLQRLDVVVIPSREEPFGLVALEAMAAGKPVVAFRSGGTPEVVEDGVTGLLATPGDIGQLAEHVTRLLKDQALRERMGEAGRRRVVKEFPIDRFLEGMRAVYREVLG